jgi:hypothetical protein
MDNTEQVNNNEATNQSARLEDFAENLLLEKNLTNIDDETLAEMRKDLVDRLEQVTNRTVVDNLPQDKLSEFEKMIDEESDPSQIQDFIAASIPNLPEKLTESYFNFRKLYLGL